MLSGQLFAPQIGPAQGAEFAKQHSSAMRWVPRTDAVVLAAVPRRDIILKRVAFHSLTSFEKELL